jgi:hypothetical protein
MAVLPALVPAGRSYPLGSSISRCERAVLGPSQHEVDAAYPTRQLAQPPDDGTLSRCRKTDAGIVELVARLPHHGLRCSHKTWMIADGIPEIAQALRLGHVLKDKVQQTYSHVATEVETRLPDPGGARSAGPPT